MSNKANRKGYKAIESLVEEVVATAAAEWSVLRDLEYSAHRPIQEHNMALNYKERFEKAINVLELVMPSALKTGVSKQRLLEHVSVTCDVFVDDLEKHFANR